jgi:hypothetical protein
MAKKSTDENLKFRERYAVKIDIRDAIWGGMAIYVTTFLLSIAFLFVAQVISWVIFPQVMPVFLQENLRAVEITDVRIVGLLFAVVASTALMSFFVAVLFEENFFSKHEKNFKDLLGLGLVWGMTVLSIDTITTAIQMPQGDGFVQLIPTIRDLTSIFYFPVVIYIILMPMAIYYLRKDKAL